MTRASAIKGLYAITPDCSDTGKLLQQARLALVGGATVLQYRNKSTDVSLHLEQAAALRKLTHEFSATFIVNDDVQLAMQVDADGVHLGATDGELGNARDLLGNNKLLGASCYNRISLAREAIAKGADYVAFGAFFPSSVKPGAVTASLSLLRQARTEFNVPMVAIGGITAQNAEPLVHAGADALAVISALFDAADIQNAARDFSGLFTRNSAP